VLALREAPAAELMELFDCRFACSKHHTRITRR
jgi:hypothetical protein